ncbi:hypothetical protein D3C81_1947410 [compost metagenome]
MFVGLGGDADRQVNHLAVAPVHPIRELQQTHTRGVHQVTGLRGAMGNGNTLTEKGRALGFTCLQPAKVTLGHQTVGDQAVSQHTQCSGFILSRLAHGYLLYSELEHAFSFWVRGPHQVLF